MLKDLLMVCKTFYILFYFHHGGGNFDIWFIHFVLIIYCMHALANSFN
jgi:hypothetical protein